MMTDTDRRLREALRKAYDADLIDAPVDDAHRWCSRSSGGIHEFDSDAWLDDLAANLSHTALTPEDDR